MEVDPRVSYFFSEFLLYKLWKHVAAKNVQSKALFWLTWAGELLGWFDSQASVCRLSQVVHAVA